MKMGICPKCHRRTVFLMEDKGWKVECVCGLKTRHHNTWKSAENEWNRQKSIIKALG